MYKICFLILFLPIFFWGQSKNNLLPRDSMILNDFNSEYKKVKYKKYTKQIIKKNNCYNFNNQVICGDESAEIKELLNNGILNPRAFEIYKIKKFFTDNPKTNRRNFLRNHKNELDFFKQDTVSLYGIKELMFLNQDRKRKRFKILLHEKPFANPLLYFIELENKKSKEVNNLIDFIKGSKLTYIQQAWFE